MVYTKEFLVNAVLWKYRTTTRSLQNPGIMAPMLNHHYDKVGKDSFRSSCNLTPDFLKLYREASKNGLDFLDVACYNTKCEI